MNQQTSGFTLVQASSLVPNVRVGAYTYSAGTPNLIAYLDTDIIEVGKFCSLANGAIIFGGGEHRSDWISTYPMRIAFGDPLANKDGHPASKGPTIIGNDVYVGYQAIVLSGVRVGHGAVIGAGSVVVDDVPDYAIVVGNPARVVKYRFSPQIIKKLLEISWWDWPIERIKKAIPFLSSPNVEEFIISEGLIVDTEFY